MPSIGIHYERNQEESSVQIVGIIPARFQSTRFPGKPLATIHGKPMIQHVYERARQASRMDRLMVATDDSRIAEAVQAFGGECMLTTGEYASGTDRVAAVCRTLGLSDEDIAVNIQGDEPLLQPSMIHLLIDSLMDCPDCAMATLGFESHDEKEFFDPNVVKLVLDRNKRALYFSRSPIPCSRDSAEGFIFFLKHLGFYAYRNGFLQAFTRLSQGILERLEKLEQLRALEHGYSIGVGISPVDTLGVDTPADLDHLLSIWEERQAVMPL
jgi:3-deoxy-manno-octulosonate cytidylyltransferase (CMP-KDO synthetase)